MFLDQVDDLGEVDAVIPECAECRYSVGIMLGQNLIRNYTDTAIVELGKRLAAVLEEPDTGFEGDVQESNQWAVMLGIRDWFDWQAFEDVPPTYWA